MSLRNALEKLLDGWRADLSQPWRQVLDSTEPDVAAVDGTLELADGEVIFPGRKGAAPPGARPDSHIFRALDGIAPPDVSVVVIGQDPYQKVSQATGRSFEQGDLQDWFGKPRVSPSLRRIIQALAAVRTGNDAYVKSGDGWRQLVKDLGDSAIEIPPPRDLWDAWQSQGVLYINAIFTFNRAEPRFQFDGHGRAWAPIVRAILGHLVRRENRSIVFVAWGNKAKQLFDSSGAEQAARDANTWQRTVTLVRRPHPNAQSAADPPFLRGENPFTQINDALSAVGGSAVAW
jgi:uracil-DNA glycosylase